MKTIYKYPIEVADSVQVLMPRGADVLSADLDNNGKMCVWAIVDTDRPMHVRAFRVVGTGNPWGTDPLDMWQFVGTVTAYPFMWHVFVFAYEGGEVSE